MMKNKYIFFSKPKLKFAELKSIKETLNSGWLTTGKKTEEFERKFKNFKKAKYALAVNSCTAALHLSLLALKLKKNDEVITTCMTFASTVNSIIHAGAKPVIADINYETKNISVEDVKKKITKNTKAIIIVHFAGYPCEMEDIIKICKKKNIYIIEDCAHAIEGKYNGKPLGTLGDFGCFSFYSTKNITTGEGGMIICKNKKFYKRIKVLSLHGMTKDAYKRFNKFGYKKYDITESGYKYNLNDIASSIGIEQLRKIKKFYNHRRKIWNIYESSFRGLNLELPKIRNKKFLHSLHLFIILISKKKHGMNRDQFIYQMNKRNIGVGVHYTPISKLSFFKKKLKFKSTDFPISNIIGDQTVSLPLSSGLKLSEAHIVARSVVDILKNEKKNFSN